MEMVEYPSMTLRVRCPMAPYCPLHLDKISLLLSVGLVDNRMQTIINLCLSKGLPRIFSDKSDLAFCFHSLVGKKRRRPLVGDLSLSGREVVNGTQVSTAFICFLLKSPACPLMLPPLKNRAVVTSRLQSGVGRDPG